MHASERLLLLRPDEQHLEAIYQIHADPRTNEFNPSGPIREYGEAEEMLISWQAHWQEYGWGYWAVATREQPETVIGIAGVMHKQQAGEQWNNLYFRFAPSAWGKGYAQEVAQAAFVLLFDELDEPEIDAFVRPNNQPSVKALERLGLQRIAEIVEPSGLVSWRYRIRREQWLAQR
jgi:ribosomal-protein-alanine N-acetyltransferase